MGGESIQEIPMFENDEIHFHLCESCLYIWSHKAEDLTDRTDGHHCPKCKSGPYFLGWTTRREVQDEKRLLAVMRKQ